jgi:TetR/AcrR family transcriptional regulator
MTAPDPDTEQKILDAAHAVFVRRGTAGARTQEIADEAGVNKALLHYYFRTKERLAEAVFERAARQLFPPLLATLTSDLSIEEKVERVIHHYIDTFRRAPFLPGYILSELHHHPARISRLVQVITGMPAGGFGSRLLTKLSQQIEERVRAGEMRPISADQFAINLISLSVFPFAAEPMLRVAFGWGEGDFQKFLDRRRRELAGFFLSGLRP